MRVAVIASVALMSMVLVVGVLMYATGLHENALIGGQGSRVLVIGANIAVVFWALKQTAKENGYLRQLGNGTLIGVIGGVLVFVASMVLLTLLPDYNETTTSVSSSMQGLIGTFFTSLIVGAIVAIFQRKKS